MTNPWHRKEHQIMLGLAVSALSLHRGQTRTQEDLAAFCDVHRRVIEKAEESGLRKLRTRLFAALGPDGIRDLMHEVQNT